MVGTQKLFGVSAQLLRQSHGLNRTQWHRQLSLRSGRPPPPPVTHSLRTSTRWQSSTTEAAKDNAKNAAKATENVAKEAAKDAQNAAHVAGRATADAAKTGGRASANTASSIVAYLYGTGLVLLLGFSYLYVTDTRAGIHQYAVVPLLRLVYSDAEEAHHAGIRSIQGMYDFGLHPRERGNADKELGDLKVEVFGHVLDNPIGTSAGIDKNAEIPDALFALGPALVEVGGATPLPQEGNPKPRVFRIPSQNALINRYGLNSEGAEHVAMQLRERVRAFAYSNGMGLQPESERIVLDGEAEVPPGSLVPGKLLAVQIAKNKTTPDNDIAAVARDYVFCVEHLAKYADVLVVNVSSPNTPGLRDLQATAPLTAILTAVVDAAKACKRKTKPAVMVKVSPDEDTDAQIEGICTAVWSSGVDGVIVGNTTKKRPDPLPKGYVMPANDTKTFSEIGGYSGPQMFERTLALVKRYRNKLDQGPQHDASSSGPAQAHKYPVQAQPANGKLPEPTDHNIDESTARDAKHLKPLTADAEKDSKQPLVQIPDRHSSEDTAQRTKDVKKVSESETAASAYPPPPSSGLLTSGNDGERKSIKDTVSGVLDGTNVRETAQAALKKLITADDTDNEPLKDKSTENEAKQNAFQTVHSEPPAKVIFATGGITNGDQCLQILNAGASVCQVYTAMMYGGVGTITRMKGEMREAIKEQSQAKGR